MPSGSMRVGGEVGSKIFLGRKATEVSIRVLRSWIVKFLHIRLFFAIGSDKARIGVLIITFLANPILPAEH